MFLTDSRYIDEYRAARRDVIGDEFKPTSTLLVIDALAAPGIVVEVEALAAKS